MVSTKKRKSWEKVVNETIAQSRLPEDTFKKLAVDGMSAWKLLLNLTSASKVLEIGAGIDSQIHNLADYSPHLFLLDHDSARLDFSKSRQRLQQSDTDISYLQCASDWRLPFADNSLDCIILSRPLAALYNPCLLSFLRMPLGLVEANQPIVRLLKEARRVLKESGQLVAVWENLLSYNKLPISRLLAAQQSTSFGYQRILKTAGFSQLDIHAFRDCNTHLYRLAPLKTSQPLLKSAKETSKHSIKRSSLLLPTFAFIASPSRRPQHTLLDRLLEDISSKLTAKLGPGQLLLTEHQITRKEKLAITASWNDDELIIKVPFNQTAFDSESNNVTMLNQLETTSPQPSFFARSLIQGSVDKQRYFVESKLQGTPLSQHLKQQGRLSYIDQVQDFLQLLSHPHKSNETKHSPLIDADYHRLVQSNIERIYNANGDTQLKITLENYFQKNLQGISVALGVQHGDFSVSNLFVNEGKINGVIDWETGDRFGVPLLDAINYLDSVHRLFNPTILINQSIPLQASGNWPVEEERDLLKWCFELYDMDPAHHQALVYLRWLRHVSYLMQYWLRFNEPAQQHFIYDIAKQLPGTLFTNP